ncbi:hypothetical protein AAC387_Pa07g2128 [Persea americana]
MRLKNRLRTTKRGNLSISDHINKLTNVANNLAFVGKPVDDDNFVTLILNGNGPAYEAIVNSVQPTDSLISLDDLIGLLLNADGFFVKDDTKRVVMIFQGNSENGFYPLQLPSESQIKVILPSLENVSPFQFGINIWGTPPSPYCSN